MEFTAEIESLNKILQEKQTDIENINEEIQGLNSTKMQKFGSLMKSQNNLPESYSEMYF